MAVNIVIADDHSQVRAALRMLIRAEEDLRVIGEAEDGDSALRLVQRLHPDVLVADINMPAPGGIELVRILRDEPWGPRVLIVTVYEDGALAAEARAAGAAGYLSKRTAAAELVNAIRSVAAGGHCWSPCGMTAGDAPSDDAYPSLDVLDQEERMLLRLLALGNPNAFIAAELSQTTETVVQMRRALMVKLNLDTRAGLVRYAREHSLL